MGQIKLEMPFLSFFAQFKVMSLRKQLFDFFGQSLNQYFSICDNVCGHFLFFLTPKNGQAENAENVNFGGFSEV